MYAIRSYYDEDAGHVDDVAVEDAGIVDQEGWSVIELLASDPSGNTSRLRQRVFVVITSYSIHYTKLYDSGSELQRWDFVYSSSVWQESHSQGLRNVYNLTEIVPPVGDSWHFEYYPSGNTSYNFV